MRIAIIHAPYSQQASTVKDSVESFNIYGSNQYEQVQVRKGEFEADLDNFDALILHYSCIAFPYRYFTPISAISNLKIANFKGTKLALVQDEQRAGIERLQFLNNLGINHLFSVSESDLYEVLYPSKERNFSISTVLTGYVSKQHIQVAKKRIPLSNRDIFVSYRGRRLPNWMGKTATLKGEIPEIVKEIQGIDNYRIDVSSDEEDRLYFDEWFEFLQKAKISIGTPSGSDYLDLHGKFAESWVARSSIYSGTLPDPVPAKYQVISPRYFDYVAAGNLVILTPGYYSSVPIAGTFIELPDDLTGMLDVIEFSKTSKAQLMVQKSQDALLSNPNLHYQYFVEQIEKTIGLFSPKIRLQIHTKNIRKQNPEFTEKRLSKFVEFLHRLYSQNPYLILALRPFLRVVSKYYQRIRMFTATMTNLSVNDFTVLIKEAPGASAWHYFSIRIFWEVATMHYLSSLMSECHYKIEFDDNFKFIKLVVFKDIEEESNSTVITGTDYPKTWVISFEKFGALQFPIVLRALPAMFKRDPESFLRWATNIEANLKKKGILEE